MPQFTIEGADPTSGQQRIVILPATDERDAEQQAKKMGLLVSRVSPFTGGLPSSPAISPAPFGTSYHEPTSLSAITTPLLISAIANAVAAMFWATTCYGFIIGVAMTTACIYQFRLYGEASRMPADVLIQKAKRMGICAIIVGLFNGVSLVCGILVVMNSAKLRPAAPVNRT
jgi:hypothetical protein